MMLSCVKTAFSLLETANRSSCGDVYGFHILIALGLNLPAAWTPGHDCETSHGLSAMSISQMTGIPRETVRRKLKALLEAGLIVPSTGKTYRLNDGDELWNCLRPIHRLAGASGGAG